MVGNERPCLTACICFGKDTLCSIQKVIAIHIIDKDLPTFDSSNDDVMKCSGSIYSGFSWHNINISWGINTINCTCVERPPNPTFRRHCFYILLFQNLRPLQYCAAPGRWADTEVLGNGSEGQSKLMRSWNVYTALTWHFSSLPPRLQRVNISRTSPSFPWRIV